MMNTSARRRMLTYTMVYWAARYVYDAVIAAHCACAEVAALCVDPRVLLRYALYFRLGRAPRYVYINVLLRVPLYVAASC